MADDMVLFSGTAHPDLAARIADELGTKLGSAEISRFSDGEVFVKLNENVRGVDVFIIQPTLAGADHLMELYMLMDAASRASAARITAVIPYFGYARQDRKDQPRVSLAAKLVANLITTAGADRVLAMDLHASQIQGFFDIPVDHLYAAPLFTEHFSRFDPGEITVVAPDLGSVKMARAYAKRLGASLAIVEKRRPKANEAEVMNVIGASEVAGRNLLIIDDMIDTGKTLVQAAKALREAGARDIYACATHAVLSGEARTRLFESDVSGLIVTDTIPPGDSTDRITVLSTASLFAEAILRIHRMESLSVLFDN
ncbi:MAG: ribose-phosphate pyrophosphokinase [Gemmatimonadota bacterium]|nr:ribose-phosphate pyrophosphokinase [Gemmatimonadota bacterium]MDP7031749.1 ribose-phosphate pyrophosphokinase [Gemmatimonadota bacterium]